MSVAEPKSRDKVLSEREEISTKLYVLENQVTQMKLIDARANLAAIDLVSFMNTSTLTFDECIEFIRNETSNVDVRNYAEMYLKAKPVSIEYARKEVEKIIGDLA